MKGAVNRKIILKERPVGIPEASHFEIVEGPVPAIIEGQVLVRNIYLSIDPAMRGWVNATANYLDPVPLGSVMRGLAIGRVVASRHPDYHRGDVVTGMFGWQDYASIEAAMIERRVEREAAGLDLPISTYLGILGLNGLTAFFGMLHIGQPKKGETIVVSAAAGSVGSCAGQIAKIKGCRTIGITDGERKRRLCVDEFAYDDAIDYEEGDLSEKLKTCCPGGIDVYFDTTSGRISDTVMSCLNIGARIVVCGTMAIPSWDPIPMGPRVERHLLVKRARMEGFVCSDYTPRYKEALEDLGQWVREGRLHYREDILTGLEEAPGSIAGLYRGDNLGKRLVKIAHETAED